MSDKNSKVLLYDDSGWQPRGTSWLTQKTLSAAWAIGTRVFRGKSIGVSSWREAYSELELHQAGTNCPIRELHVWGHGSRGNPHLGPRGVMNIRQLADGLPDLEAVWWRSCSVHASHNFARKVADTLGAASIGHCVVISSPNPLRQGAICGILPGGAPHWHLNKRDAWVYIDEHLEERPLPSCGTLRSRIPLNLQGMWREDYRELPAPV